MDDQKTRLICACTLWAGALQAAATIVQAGRVPSKKQFPSLEGLAPLRPGEADQAAIDVVSLASRILRKLPEFEKLPEYKDLQEDWTDKD